MEILRTRFDKNKALHSELEWTYVEKSLLADPESLEILRKMEESGGEPDTIGYDVKTGKLLFCDCAKESPVGRRSLCYDTVFTFHNGTDSYYSVRGFRGYILI